MRNLCTLILLAIGIAIANPLSSFGQGEVIEGKLQRIQSDKIDKLEKKIDDKVDKIQRDVDSSEDAKKIANSILNPIYQLAEKMSFSGFYWMAFALMFAGVVNFALQIALGKLFMLAKFHFSLIEIFSDALCLLMSVTGLVLTTQAATETRRLRKVRSVFYLRQHWVESLVLCCLSRESSRSPAPLNLENPDAVGAVTKISWREFSRRESCRHE